MRKVTFCVEGYDGEFVCDADELTSYKTLKQFAQSETNPAGMFDALERVYMGHDEEYAERMGGVENMGALNDAAVAAVNAKKSQASSSRTKTAKTK